MHSSSLNAEFIILNAEIAQEVASADVREEPYSNLLKPPQITGNQPKPGRNAFKSSENRGETE